MGVVTRYAVGCAACILIAVPAAGQLSFQVNRISGIAVSSAGVQVLAVGDMTSDARDDIIAVDNDGDRFDLYVNDGTGAFPSAAVPFGSGGGPVAAAVGDFNFDGHLDVATANEDADTVTTYLGDGTGNFTNPNDFDVDPAPVALVAIDLDNDRRDDLAVLSDETVYLLRSNGDGTFTPFSPASRRTLGSGGTSIVSGRFDDDDNQDLAITLGDANQVSVLLGSGTGTFETPRLINVGTLPNGLVVGALRMAGTLDIAVVDSDELADLNVSLLFGDGMGSFQGDKRTTAEVASVGIAAADFNQDGAVDLAVTNVSGSLSVALLLNDPSNPMAENGFVLLSRGIGLARGATAISRANLNGDAYPDLVALGVDENGVPLSIGALINTTNQPPTPSPTRTATPTVTPPNSPPPANDDDGCTMAPAGRQHGAAVWVLGLMVWLGRALRRRRSSRVHRSRGAMP